MFPLFAEADGVGLWTVEVAEVVGCVVPCDNEEPKGAKGDGRLEVGTELDDVVGGTKTVTVGVMETAGRVGGKGCRVCTTVTVIGRERIGTFPSPSPSIVSP